MWQLCYYSHIIFLNFIIDFRGFKILVLKLFYYSIFYVLKFQKAPITDYQNHLKPSNRLPNNQTQKAPITDYQNHLKNKQQITKQSNPKSTDYRLPKSPQKQATDYQTIKPKKHR
jgi:hypothetical protein